MLFIAQCHSRTFDLPSIGKQITLHSGTPSQMYRSAISKGAKTTPKMRTPLLIRILCMVPAQQERVHEPISEMRTLSLTRRCSRLRDNIEKAIRLSQNFNTAVYQDTARVVILATSYLSQACNREWRMFKTGNSV